MKAVLQPDRRTIYILVILGFIALLVVIFILQVLRGGAPYQGLSVSISEESDKVQVEINQLTTPTQKQKLQAELDGKFPGKKVEITESFPYQQGDDAASIYGERTSPEYIDQQEKEQGITKDADPDGPTPD